MSDIRSAFYMANLTGIRYNPVLREQYQNFFARKGEEGSIDRLYAQALVYFISVMPDNQPFKCRATV
jgi:hypothetical protein